MVDLLEKFENVTVDPAARISPEDAAWCEGEQMSYSRAHKLYTEFRTLLAESIILENDDWEERSYNDYNTYPYSETNGSGGLDDIDKRIKEIQRNFISSIRYYFSKKYNVDLDSDSIRETLGMEEPEYDHKLDDSAWEKIEEEYHIKSTRLLHFNEIIDEILIQLDGLTFVDKAVQQIKNNARNGAHDRYSNNKCYFTINNKTIQFQDSFLLLFDNYSSVLLALWHFNTGLTSLTGYYWSSELLVHRSYTSADRRVGSPFVFENYKACKLRYFKSGRWDVTFATAEYAYTFAREYLGY